MNPEKANSIVSIILSLVPFVVVGAWFIYRGTKSKHSIIKKTASTKKIIRVGDKNYMTKKASRMLVVEKKTGREAIVTTCGFENEQKKMEGELKSLPKWVKVCYRLENGIFSPEESDWLAGEEFSLLQVAHVEEYEQA